ncbi:hypothetical protein CXF68_04395 [Tenacibaculum sp. Bg11-29]|uniref:hypothetical protein n=1 Tax=Tenacibaculum sp. Bg11-29 TaxID=2058306 RepID=UPI000C322A70|nr:hypothetical protein [Tenacibaculum sp. Bg11-29]PKH49987.1 hypothetical protein CXF68_04395 [Tenacibaculum sp. Bg11-29]
MKNKNNYCVLLIKQTKHLLVIAVLLVVIQSCSKTTQLQSCWNKQADTTDKNLITFFFKEELNKLGHNFEPWEKTKYSIIGNIWVNQNRFLKLDTLTINSKAKYYSKIEYSKNTLLHLDYGNKELSSITNDIYLKQLIKSARYTPVYLLNHFVENSNKLDINTGVINNVYSINIGKIPVKLFINKSTNLIDKITYLTYDELYGDVITSYLYLSYKKSKTLSYPSKIEIKKINGKVVDKVEIFRLNTTADKIQLLDKPDNYKLIASKKNGKIKVKTEKFNDFIYFINLVHTEDKIMVVEFEDFMLVAEAPLNSKNGELIISEVKKIAPLKPIKYFVFGHHHPHYLGGIRAFVHKEATVLCTNISKEYVEYIAKAPHTIQPDSLQFEPKKLKTKTIQDSFIIGKENQLNIYFIGAKSEHTKDYLIYYFPKEKLLFQDDLCWIPKEGSIGKANARQRGLYNSIKELKLNVKTIIQSWPVESHKVKTIIPFQDLEKSIK